MKNINRKNIYLLKVCLILLQFAFLGKTLFCQSGETGYNQFVIGSFHNPNISNSWDRRTDIGALRLAKDLGINTLTFPYYFDPRTQSFNDYLLDICNEVGLNYVVSDSRHMIYSAWDNPLVNEIFDPSIANDVTNHYTSLNTNLRSALFGYRIKDEPSPSVINSTHLPVIQSWINHFKVYDNAKYSLVNLLPAVATYYSSDPDFLTLTAYENYLDEYLNCSDENCKPDIASIDIYPSSADQNLYFYNLKLFREKAQGRPMWGHIQVNRQQPSDSIPFIFPGAFFNPDESYIRFQTNCHLAYGFKGIIYFPYENPELDYGLVRYGYPTSKYYWVKDLNNYIKNIVAPVIMNSHYLGTYHKGNFVDKDGTILETISSDQIFNPYTTPLVEYLSDSKSMIGLFYDETTKNFYIYIVNKGFLDDHGAINVTVGLKGDKRGKIFVAPTSGPDWNYAIASSNFNSYTTTTYFTVLNLLPGEGRMYKITDKGFGEWDAEYTNTGDETNHPVSADYDGDGKADLSVKTDNGDWRIDFANNGFGAWDISYSQYGGSDAHPVPADYDGDGKADLSGKADWGTWYINYSNDGFSDGWDQIVTGYGDATNHPVPADYDGDGKADLSIKSDNGE